jgi:hypothetical protein
MYYSGGSAADGGVVGAAVPPSSIGHNLLSQPAAQQTQVPQAVLPPSAGITDSASLDTRLPPSPLPKSTATAIGSKKKAARVPRAAPGAGRSKTYRPDEIAARGARTVSGGVSGGNKSGKMSKAATAKVAAAAGAATLAISGKDSDGAATLPQEEPMTLAARKSTLQCAIDDRSDEYHLFAKFLDKRYVLTDNTDRQTSRDYVRLCTLKDECHKQCVNDKDRLKIYKIKSFFSKVLRLEVTGEWDRKHQYVDFCMPAYILLSKPVCLTPI